MSLCWAQVCLRHSRFQPRNVGFVPVASPEAIAVACRPELLRVVFETDGVDSETGLTECILSG